ncbi:MAG: hypothetical protein IPM29_12415 [Planctomycetes bacterium]|nr:hypothetical protein [Planctomycetota bacterium]
MRTLSLLAASVLVAPLCGQVFTDDFNSYPNGPLLAGSGWTPQTGTFQVQSGRLSATSGGVWAYITKDGFTPTDCVLDGTFYYSTASAVQFAGLTARFTSATAGLLMTKIQNNGGTADFDRCFAYNRPGSSTYGDIPGGTLMAQCRMIVLDGSFYMEVDSDMDGLFDNLTITNTAAFLTAGGIGMNGYQTSEMDDFEFFDAVLMPAPGAVPQIGTSYTLELDSTTPNLPYLGILSGGNSGLPLGDGRKIPLTPDAVFLATAGAGSIGLAGLTDAGGDATTAIPIPAIPALVGVRLYAGFITIDGVSWLGIGNISNEHGFVIQP